MRRGRAGVLVGVARRPRSSDDGKERSITRLTWLMNLDSQGLVPAFLVQSALLTSASYPRLKLLALEKWMRGKKEADLSETVAKLRERLGRKDEEHRRKEEELRENFETLKERYDELEDANEHLTQRLKELLAKVKED